MRSTFLVAWSNLRRRKKQNLLAGVSIFLSVVMMTTALGILGGIQKPFDVMFDRLSASHLLLLYDSRQNDTEKITTWFSNQAEVEVAAEPQHYFLVTEPMTFGTEKINIMVYVTEMGEHQTRYDRLLKMDGSDHPFPGWGEVWIPKHLSVRYGIGVGDTLRLPLAKGLYPLIVSAVVVDPHYVSGMINPNRIWIAPGMLPFMVQLGELNQVVQGVRLKQKDDIEKVWARFKREMNYQGSNLQYSLFKSVFTSVYKIIGLVIIVFSVLSIVIACYIISSIISSSVMSDNRLTGTLIALGFKPGQVTNVYMLQYAMISLLAIPAGLMASYFAVRIILQSVSASIGLTNLNFPFFILFISMTLFFAGLLFFLIRIHSTRAGRIQPAQALRSIAGDTHISRKNRWFPFRIEYHSLPFWMALKLIFDHPVKSSLTGISLVIAAFILVFSVNIANSFNRINDYKTSWGFDNSDLQVYRSGEVLLPIEHEKFMRLLTAGEAIKEAVPFSYYDLTLPVPGDNPPEELTGKVFEKSPGMIGLTNIQGEHPDGENEISLCIGTSRKLNKGVGDSVPVWIENEKKKFIVSGIYQDISNLGKGFRLSADAVKAINPLYEPDRYLLKLAEPGKTNEYKLALLKRFGESIKIELTIEEQLAFMGITQSINGSLILIALFFAGILVVSVFNDIFLGIWENRKTIGILSLTGFTAAQLKRIMIWKTCILAVAGILAGIPLVMILGPLLMGSITSGFGVVHFPFAVTPVGSLLALVLLILVAVMSSWWASASVKRINTLILVNE